MRWIGLGLVALALFLVARQAGLIRFSTTSSPPSETPMVVMPTMSTFDFLGVPPEGRPNLGQDGPDSLFLPPPAQRSFANTSLGDLF